MGEKNDDGVILVPITLAFTDDQVKQLLVLKNKIDDDAPAWLINHGIMRESFGDMDYVGESYVCSYPYSEITDFGKALKARINDVYCLVDGRLELVP